MIGWILDAQTNPNAGQQNPSHAPPLQQNINPPPLPSTLTPT